MQTFLPYSDFTLSAQCLDYRRLCKQRLEAYQLFRILTGQVDGGRYRIHPATKMWKGYEESLKCYYNIILTEWINRGYNNTMEYMVADGIVIDPPWLGDPNFHMRHKSKLLEKNFEYYYNSFLLIEREDLILPPVGLEYWWPSKGEV